MEIKVKVRGVPTHHSFHSYNLDEIPINLLEDTDYVLAVDPSTTATAIIVANTVNYKADMFIEFKRDVEVDDTEFNSEVYRMVESLITKYEEQLIACAVEKPFRHPFSTNDKYSKQRANFSLWQSLCKRHNILFHSVSPQSWRGNFTKTYGRFITGDKRKVTKARIKAIYGRHECLDLLELSTDISDAYGILQYYKVKYAGGLRAAKETEREYNHHLQFVICRENKVNHFLEMFTDTQRKKGYNPRVMPFEYSDDISPEDNLRCFTSVSNKQREHVYISAITPTIGNIRYLYRYRKLIGEKIDRGTSLFLIGYRK